MLPTVSATTSGREPDARSSTSAISTASTAAPASLMEKLSGVAAQRAGPEAAALSALVKVSKLILKSF